MGWEGARRGTFETVLIGPSMGGLVIKRAYMLARQGAAYKYWPNASTRSFFFATTYRGSDPAKLLNNILHFAHSSRAYVERGFGAVQSINDEFRNCSADVHLCSFYETKSSELMSQKDGWVTEKSVFQSRLDCGKAIIEVLPRAIAGKFIMSAHE